VSAALRPRAGAQTQGQTVDHRLYRDLSPGDRYIHRTRDDAFLALLKRFGVADLGRLRILELGCGDGAFLRTLMRYGALSENLTAFDIDRGRVRRARAVDASMGLLAADGAALPYAAASFDLAVAFTMLSSVVDEGARRAVALEALRVLRPGGLLVVYDFKVNPFNRHVRPVTAAELRALVAPAAVEIERVTLAPPLARAFGRWPAVCQALEAMPPLRTHLLAAIVKEAA
jgi:ubiquinone/menaquinone biosynthesis C-methylase UbiE